VRKKKRPLSIFRKIHQVIENQSILPENRFVEITAKPICPLFVTKYLKYNPLFVTKLIKFTPYLIH
jgi:hypothetical protein